MKPELRDLRGELDALDEELTALLERRFELTDEIGARKRAAHAPVRDEAREQQIVLRAALALRDKEKVCDLAAVYDRIFERSRKRQENG